VTRQRRTGSAVVALLVIAFALVAGVPIQTRDLGSHPRPPFSYDSSVAEIARRRASEETSVAPGARSILQTHGGRTPIAVLLLHGFTNSPRQFDSLARMLYREGDNVYVPRLPHHADLIRGPSALSDITAEELSAAADSAMDVVRALGDTVVVVGLSLGGTMAAWIAQNRADATRVVVVAPLIALARVPSFLDGAVVNLTVRLPNITRDLTSFDGEPDRELGWSTRAIGQILRLGVAVERASTRHAPRSRAIAFVLNANDRTISAAPVMALNRRWAVEGASVQTYELPATLGLPHDVIDPRQRIRRPDVVYPLVMDLVSGRRPLLDPLSSELMADAGGRRGDGRCRGCNRIR
jgi:esterase/lipase